MQVIFEDNHIIAVNKAVSEIVQGDKTGDESLDITIKKYLKKKYNKPGNVFLGVAHRIDRPVSGVVLFAKTSKALTRLNKLFHNNGVKKTYHAIVAKPPPAIEGQLIHYLVRNTKQNKSYCYDRELPQSKRAVLHYKVLKKSERYWMLEIDLKTGRHHQIRAQLAAMGCPIKGDLKYGYPRSNHYPGICLHAHSISFIHPVTNEKISLEAKPPEKEKLWKIFYNAPAVR
ncbi:MAG: RluA family pseudouridine synthase [Bacteroidota bacterium]